MQSDLAGRVRNTKLASKHALLPLFEAIANSIDSISEAKLTEGRIEVTIERSMELFSSSSDDGNLLPEISGFSIVDDGIGFTTKNFQSFDTLDSLSKQSAGGKGIGRLLWLVAFDSASVDSRFIEGEATWHRTFNFRRSSAGVEQPVLSKLETLEVRPITSVRLQGYYPKYRDVAPKSAKAIAKRIIEHFLIFYMLDVAPSILLMDPDMDSQFDLSDMYKNEFSRGSSARPFKVKEIDFTITDVLLRSSAEADSALHFCANRRVVKSQKLSSVLAHTESSLHIDGNDVFYAGCITSPFLDERVDAQRTDFSLDNDGELSFVDAPLTWEDVVAGARAAVEAFLKEHLERARERSVERIRGYVETEEPRYRILLEHKPDLVALLPGNLSDERLELELHKALQDWRYEAKVEATKQLKGVKQDADSFTQFKDGVFRALGALKEVAKADLADYVVHRRAVLDFFEHLLGMEDTGKFAKEDALHGLFFPLRMTSDQIDYEDHNLWLVDEALSFHRYLASDLPFNSQSASPAVVDNTKRPDLLIYNRKMAFAAEDQRPFSSVVIVEFKRPELNSYTDERNPVTQVYGYVRDLREGKAKNPDGSSVDRLGSSVPFFCHVVVSLTPQLREQLENMDFTLGPDEQSYFAYNQNLRVYVEVSSYTRVLQTAVKRNKAFFNKLGLHTGSRRL
jgi:hypothetical protein